MTNTRTSAAMRSGLGVIPRNMVLTFAADRQVRTEAGEIPAARLRPGDRVLSGANAGLSVVSVTGCSAPQSRDKRPMVRVIVGQDATEPRTRLPVGGRVSSRDGRLHLT